MVLKNADKFGCKKFVTAKVAKNLIMFFKKIGKEVIWFYFFYIIKTFILSLGRLF